MFKLIFSFLLLNLFTLSLSYAFDIKQLTERANSGDISSQLDLARSYLNKDNVQQNNKLAFQWFQKAAENSNPSTKSIPQIGQEPAWFLIICGCIGQT